MNLHALLRRRESDGKPLRVGLIGAGKFGAMYLAQVPRTPGVHLVGIADLSPAAARSSLDRVGWRPEQFGAASLDDALAKGNTHLGDDWGKLVAHPGIDIIIECTGNPPAAVEHCLGAFAHGKHVVNVTVEADAFCGPLLARRASEAGVVYSLAYGDQPGLICDLVDWARACGFPVVAAGRGHKWLPHFSESTPDTVWNNWGLTPEQAKIGGLNPKMFNSFLDGSKPSIESTAVCNATGLVCSSSGTCICIPSCNGKCQGADDGCGGTCPTNACKGCCDTTNTCLFGKNDTACGFDGAACVDCTANSQTCGGKGICS